MVEATPTIPEDAVEAFERAYKDAYGLPEARRRAALTAAAPLIRAQWQPIETAPKDGAPLLVFDGEHIAVARFAYTRWWIAESFGRNDDGEIYHISHWMPLPAPPAAIRSAP